MEIKEIKQTLLEASEGKILTNGTAYGKVVALGAGDKAENWYEIPIEEYEAALAEEETVEETV
jgi:hypothetical protein